MHHLHDLCLQRPEEGVTGETDGCELLYGYWELDLVPLKEELGLLTTELSLHPFAIYFVIQLHCSPEQTL